MPLNLSMVNHEFHASPPSFICVRFTFSCPWSAARSFNKVLTYLSDRFWLIKWTCRLASPRIMHSAQRMKLGLMEQWDVEGWLIQLAEAAAGNEGENGKWKHMSFVAICENKKLSVSHTGPVNPKTTAGQPKSKKPVHVSGKTHNATLHEHIEVLDWHCSNGQNQLKTACHFADVYPIIGTVTDKNIAHPCGHPLFPQFWLCTWTYSYTFLYDI